YAASVAGDARPDKQGVFRPGRRIKAAGPGLDFAQDFGLPVRGKRARRRQTTGFTSVPIGVISTETESPGWRYRGGLKPIPTPAGVPVAMRSPGRKVMLRDSVSMMVGISKIRSDRLAFWRNSPLTRVSSLMAPISGTS